MIKAKKVLIFIAVFGLLIMPIVSFGAQDPTAEGLVKCEKDCGWNDIMALVNELIDFALTKMVVPIAAIMFAYAGLLLVTSGGESGEARSKAKDIFWNTVLGLVIAVAAWLIISTILSILGYDGAWIGLTAGV